MKKIKIVTDSSSDLMTLDGVAFATAPLKIITAERQYVDDQHLDTREMVTDLYSYRGKSSTSCPNIGDWLEVFGDAEWIFCVTITGTLSGSFNSAMNAKRTYEEEYPDRRVFVIDSLSTGPEMTLIIEKLQELILAGKTYEEICTEITEYQQHGDLLFMLESLKSLANNGRVSKLVASAAGILGIRMVGKASDQGTLEPLNKCRGEKKAILALADHMVAMGYEGGKMRISHCLNSAAAETLKANILAAYPQADVQIRPTGGLCSFYAEKGGLLIGFEK